MCRQTPTVGLIHSSRDTARLPLGRRDNAVVEMAREGDNDELACVDLGRAVGWADGADTETSGVAGRNEAAFSSSFFLVNL